MAPEIRDGEVVVISPAEKIVPSAIVAFSFKDGREGKIKRLVSELFKPASSDSNCQLLITVEVDCPRRRFLLDRCEFDGAQAVIGVIRGGAYVPTKPRTLWARDLLVSPVGNVGGAHSFNRYCMSCAFGDFQLPFRISNPGRTDDDAVECRIDRSGDHRAHEAR